jgi:hypothetical protein
VAAGPREGHGSPISHLDTVDADPDLAGVGDLRLLIPAEVMGFHTK